MPLVSVPVPAEVRAAIDELRDLAEEGIAYTPEYFQDKWQMPQRFADACAILDKWLETLSQKGDGE